MKIIGLIGVMLMTTLLGCFGPPRENPPDRIVLRSVDGLDRVDIALPGLLEIRENHRIGSYDAFLIPDASISYKRESLRLSREGQAIFLTMLRDTLIDASEAAAIPILQEPGACVMQIELEVARMDLDTARRADQLAEMTLVMQFRDSESGDPLLRYATLNRVPNPDAGTTHDEQIREGLKQIIADMEISGALRGAGLANDEIDPGCQGTLAARGRANAQRQ